MSSAAASFDPLPYLPKPPAALSADLRAPGLTLTPAVVRAHPTYAHEILLVRARAAGPSSTEWTLPARAIPSSPPSPAEQPAEKLGGALRTAVLQDTGLAVRGVVGAGLLDAAPGGSRRGSASTASSAASDAPDAHVFYVVVAEGALALDGERYAESMWAKAAEVPALQIGGEARRAALAALEMAGRVA